MIVFIGKPASGMIAVSIMCCRHSGNAIFAVLPDSIERPEHNSCTLQTFPRLVRINITLLKHAAMLLQDYSLFPTPEHSVGETYCRSELLALDVKVLLTSHAWHTTTIHRFLGFHRGQKDIRQRSLRGWYQLRDCSFCCRYSARQELAIKAAVVGQLRHTTAPSEFEMLQHVFAGV